MIDHLFVFPHSIRKQIFEISFRALNFVGGNFDTFKYVVALYTGVIVLFWVRERTLMSVYLRKRDKLLSVLAPELYNPFRSLQRIERVDVFVAKHFCLGVSMIVSHVDENFRLVWTEETAHWTYPVLCQILTLRILYYL